MMDRSFKRCLPAVLYCFVCLGLLLCFRLALLNYGQWDELSDAWEHAATVRAMAENFTQPAHPYYHTPGATTPRFTVYVFMVAVVADVFGLSAMHALDVFFFVNILLFFGGVYCFFSYFLRSNLAPVIALIVLIFFWGKGWLYSNSYTLSFLPLGLFFPAMFSFVLCFWGWFFLLHWVRRKNLLSLVAFALCGFCSFHAHPLTGSLFFLYSFCALFDNLKKVKRFFAAWILLVLLCALFSTLWPYGNFWQDMFSGVSKSFYHPTLKFFLLTNIPYRIGFALFGILLLPWLWYQKKSISIIVAVMISSFFVVLAFVTDLPLLERYVFFVTFFLHVSITIGILEIVLGMQGEGGNAKKVYLPGVVIVIVLMAILLQGFLFFRLNSFVIQKSFLFDRKIAQLHAPENRYAVLREHLNASDVILSDSLTSWVVPAMSSAKIIFPYRNIPFNKLRQEKERDVRLFFGHETSDDERKRVLAKYDISHVVINANVRKFSKIVLQELDVFIDTSSANVRSFLNRNSMDRFEHTGITVFVLQRDLMD